MKKEEKEGTIVVENTGAYERYQYLPYGVDFSSIQCLDTLYRDLNLQKNSGAIVKMKKIHTKFA